jgi:hypothetical protein
MNAAAASHLHRWVGVEFFLEDGHPKLRMSCACGAERVIRAWERFWSPTEEGDQHNYDR